MRSEDSLDVILVETDLAIRQDDAGEFPFASQAGRSAVWVLQKLVNIVRR